jgi:hypothetical protein
MYISAHNTLRTTGEFASILQSDAPLITPIIGRRELEGCFRRDITTVDRRLESHSRRVMYYDFNEISTLEIPMHISTWLTPLLDLFSRESF